MKCPRCGKRIERDYSFCPSCGTQLARRRSLFDVFFPRFEKEMKEMDRMFERRFETFDITPLFRQPVKGRGFTIKITRKGGEKPKVSVQTFGGVKKEDIERQVKSQFKTGGPLKVGFRPKERKPLPQMPARRPEVPLPEPKTTEEPKTQARRAGNMVVVDMELPGVRSERDIRIKELQESVEVRAIAGKRGFFKIVTKPAQFRLVKKSFDNSKLHMEFG